MEAEELALGTLEQVATDRGQDALAAEAREARAALANRRFNVAVVGQFKRGKSTLVNALLGRELLPADVAPVTSAITIVEHGSHERATVHFADGNEREVGLDALRSFVSEEEKPANRKAVRVVRLELPCALLESGMRLVDTPGVGSVFAANAEVTRAFLARIDVAVVVLGSDPPISGEELALVKEVAPGAGRVLVVLNKADRVREATREKAEAFTRQVLRDALGEDPGPLIQASARTALREGSDPGVSALSAQLAELAEHSGAELARGSAARAARHVASHLAQEIDLEAAALRTPLEELDGRIEAFRDAMRDLDDLVIAACTRVSGEFGFDWHGWEDRRDALACEVIGGIRPCIEGLAERAPLSRRAVRVGARGVALEEVKRHVTRWVREASDAFERHRTAQVERVSAETNRLIDRVAEATTTAFGTPLARYEPEAVVADVEAIGFDFIEPVAALDASAWVLPVFDALSPRRVVVRRARNRAERLAREWLRRNLHAIDARLIEWIDALTRQLEAGMRARLEAVRQEVLEAVETGRTRHRQGEAAISQRLAELDRQCALVGQATGSLGGQAALLGQVPADLQADLDQ